jgi:hypothetical protein
MTGDEIITITIKEPNLDKTAHMQYSVREADLYRVNRGEFHIKMIDYLVEKYEKYSLNDNSKTN